MIGKQAKVLSGREITQVLSQVKLSRYPERNEVMVLLSLKAGLRAKEISLITWSTVTDASGEIGEVLHLPHQSTKGKSGRIIPLNKELKRSLTTLYELVSPEPHHHVITSERGERMLPCNISHWFKNVFNILRLEGCSSHSGRRTFITNAARRIIEVGGSLRDVQQLAGHTSLQMTQRYIEGNTEAKRKVIDLI